MSDYRSEYIAGEKPELLSIELESEMTGDYLKITGPDGHDFDNTLAVKVPFGPVAKWICERQLAIFQFAVLDVPFIVNKNAPLDYPEFREVFRSRFVY